MYNVIKYKLHVISLNFRNSRVLIKYLKKKLLHFTKTIYFCYKLYILCTLIFANHYRKLTILSITYKKS